MSSKCGDTTDMNLSNLQDIVEDRGALHAAANGVAEIQTWVRSLGQKDPLAKGMATHSCILDTMLLLLLLSHFSRV